MSDQVRTKPLRAAKLVWREDRNTVKEYVLYEGFTTLIGREKSNHIILKNPVVSKRHAQVNWHGRSFVITDLDSSNGTFVNGTPIYSPTKLKDNCRINIGEYVLSFHELEDPVFEPPQTVSMPEAEITAKTLFIEEDGEDMTTFQDIPWSIEMLAEDRPPPETLTEDTIRITESDRPIWLPIDQKTEPGPEEESPEQNEMPDQGSIDQQATRDEPEYTNPMVDLLEEQQIETLEEMPVPEHETHAEPESDESSSVEDALEVEQIDTTEKAPIQATEAEPPTSQAPTTTVAPQEIEIFVDAPTSSQDAYTELLLSIQTAHSMGQALRNRWLAVLTSIETSITKFQTICQEMVDLENQASSAKLDELFSSLSSNPNNVRVLVELADRSDLIEKILKDYFAQGDKIEKIKDDLESVLKS